MMPKKNDIAICGAGRIGIITCDEPQPIYYADTPSPIGEGWIGIHIAPLNWAGKPWSSRNPTVIAHLDETGHYIPANLPERLSLLNAIMNGICGKTTGGMK
jgi:hypothetical protein